MSVHLDRAASHLIDGTFQVWPCLIVSNGRAVALELIARHPVYAAAGGQARSGQLDISEANPRADMRLYGDLSALKRVSR